MIITEYFCIFCIFLTGAPTSANFGCLRRNGSGHIALFQALLIGNTRFSGDQRIQSWPFAGHRLGGSSGTNQQDLVFIRPPGTQDGGFELGLDNVWFCRVLLLFKIKSQTDSGLKEFECAYVSVLEQCTGHRAPGCFLLHILEYF